MEFTKSDETEVLIVHPETPETERIARAAALLRAGEVVAFPTETVYGLGANALDAEAVARIYVAKGRPVHNPLIVHVPDVEAAKQLVTEWPETADRLAERFWPGPLTLVLPRRESIPDIVTGGGPTVAIRIPSHPVAQALLRAAGLPLAAPSANRSEQLSPTRAEHVFKSLSGRIPLILDGGPTSGGLESTVLALGGKYPTLLRPGLISPAEIEAVVGPVRRRALTPTPSPKNRGGEQSASLLLPPVHGGKGLRVRESLLPPVLGGKAGMGGDEEDQSLPSPGMMARHYAPNAPLEIIPPGDWVRAKPLLEQGKRIGWLTFTPHASVATIKQRYALLFPRPMPRDPAGYAERLYAALHELDEAGVERILVEAVPESEAWLAIRDRLQRAATPGQEESENS